MPVEMIEISNIIVRDRLRNTSPEWVGNLAKSIERDGLLNPISIAECEGNFYLAAGSHRLEACKQLQHTHIDCNLTPTTPENLENTLRMIEVTENLMRNDLTPLHRAASLAEMKRVYEDLHPETKKGGDPNKKLQNDILSFSKAAAEKTGLSVKSIERAVAIYKGLSPASYKALEGTEIAQKQSDLIVLSKLDHKKQKQTLKLVLNKKSGLNTVPMAIAEIEGNAPEKNPENDAFNALLAKWTRAPEKARKKFISHLKQQGAV